MLKLISALGRCLAVVMLQNDQILKWKSKLHQLVVRLQSVFGSHCSFSAEDPNELIGFKEEFSATPIDRIVLIVSVQNPVVLSWKQRNGLDFELCRFFSRIVIGLDDLPCGFAAVFPGRVEDKVIFVSINFGDFRLATTLLRVLSGVVIMLNFIPSSEIIVNFEVFHDRRRGAPSKSRGQANCQQ